MKAINRNGKITIYQGVPNSFTSSAGTHMNAPKMSDEELKNVGLFDVKISDDYDERVHDLGEIYWVTEETVFKKDLVDKTWSETLSELKEKRINNFNNNINRELQKTDWYIIRKADSGDVVPDSVTTNRVALRTQSATVETEINALTTKKEVVLYDFPNI